MLTAYYARVVLCLGFVICVVAGIRKFMLLDIIALILRCLCLHGMFTLGFYA